MAPDFQSIVILSFLVGTGMFMLVVGHRMWALKQDFFGLALGLGGTAILSMAVYAAVH